ncbi:MAG: T9SS type A sorting domain-containing protein, partial [Fidelibacterota bacterium]
QDTNLYFSWNSLADIQLDNHTTLSGWNGMVRAEIVRSLHYTSMTEVVPDFSHDFYSVMFHLETPYALDTTTSNIVTVLPSGNVPENTVSFADRSIRVKTPLETGGDYRFYAHLVRQDRALATDTVFTWSVPVPEGFMVTQNYPNPFNAATLIPVRVLERGTVTINIYNLLGREVHRIEKNTLEPGAYEFRMQMENYASGIYFVRIQYARERDEKTTGRIMKMALIK